MLIKSTRLRVLGTVLALTLSALAVVRAATPDVLTWVLTVTGEASNPASNPPLVGSTLSYAVGLAIGGPLNRIYVTETEESDGSVLRDRVRVFNQDGTEAFRFGGPSPSQDDRPGPPLPGEFKYPMGVAVDATGQILVVDTQNDRLQLFAPNGTFANVYGTASNVFGGSGNFDTQDVPEGESYSGPPPIGPASTPGIVLDGFNWPTRVALRPGTVINHATDTTGRIAVADTGNHRVIVYNARFQPLYAVGGITGNGLGELDHPIGVGLDLNYLYVTDDNKHRVQIYQLSNGAPVRHFGSNGGPDLEYPWDAQPDDKGQLLVADTNRNRILILAPVAAAEASTTRCSETEVAASLGECSIQASDLSFYQARVLGSEGSGPGQFVYPLAVATDALARVAVLEFINHRFQIFQGARLQIVSAAAAPASVEAGSTVTVTATIKNTGASALHGVTVTAVPSGNATLTSSANWNVGNLAIGQEAPVTSFTFVANETGLLKFAVGATGLTDASNTLVTASFTTTAVTVTPSLAPGMTVSVAASPSPVPTGGTVTVTVTVKNTGNVPLENVVPTLTASTAGGTLLPAPTPQPAATIGIAPDAVKVFTYSYVVPSVTGEIVFHAAATSITGSLSKQSSPDATVAVVSDAQKPAITLAASGTYLPVMGTLETAAGVQYPQAIYRSRVKINLTATDDQGLAAIHYKVVGLDAFTGVVNAPAGTAPLTMTAEFYIPQIPLAQRDGNYVIYYWAVDKAGNVQTANAPPTTAVIGVPPGAHLQIDTTPPTVTLLSITPAASSTGWYTYLTGRPTVTFSASDSQSGIVAADRVYPVTTDGAAIVVSHTAYDRAGNSATASVTVKVDTVKPTLTCSAGNPIVWPPNHKPVDWQPIVSASDATSTLGTSTFRLDTFFSSEDGNPRGSGNTKVDMLEWTLGIPDTMGQVLVERSGKGIGRTYTLVYMATDLAGNTASCTVTLTVPHDQSKK